MRLGAVQPGDDQLLAEFLLSFREFAENTFFRVVATTFDARERIDPLNTFIAERTVKSSRSITDKLVRESTLRLPTMQDIVGCRIILNDVNQQDIAVALLSAAFPDHDLKDRRDAPTHGYRAVHLIVKDGRLRYEIQLRTRLQQIWATIVERLIDPFGIEIKYGGGPSIIQSRLQGLSSMIGAYERNQDSANASVEQIIRAIDNLESEIRGLS